MEPLYFNSVNPNKRAEMAILFEGSRRPLRFLEQGVVEILEVELEPVIREKALAAYAAAGVPVLVEHGGLHIDHLGGLPGALVQAFWHRLGGRACEQIPAGADRAATAVSALCYCDGRVRRVWRGEVKGRIAESARGTGGYHWDPLFIPDGETRTFAEMTPAEKLARSPASVAAQKLRRDLGI